jgi:hypothetical protein
MRLSGGGRSESLSPAQADLCLVIVLESSSFGGVSDD